MTQKQLAKLKSECYVCGAPAVSHDHIPPRCLFPKPRPKNLITVPSCKAHNEDQNLDDDYFRLIIAGMAEDDARAGDVLKRAVRGLEKNFKKSPKYQKRLQKAVIPKVAVTTPGGIFLRYAPGLSLEHARMLRVVDRIVRGVYYKERGNRLPENVPVWGAHLNPPWEPPYSTLVPTMPISWKSDDGTFQYRLGVLEPFPTISVMALIFYERVIIVSGTGEPEQLQVRADS